MFNEYRWSKIKRIGMFKYIIKYGILFWGMPLGALIGLISEVSSNGIESMSTLLFSSIGGALYGILIGIIYGACSWFYNQRKYSNMY